MDLVSILIGGFLFLVSLLTPQNPQTSQVNLEINSQQLVFYNYTYLTYSSPFALNYSYLLFGNTYNVREIEEVQKNAIRQQKNQEAQFSFGWIIELERMCPLPNNAKLEIVTRESIFSIYKVNSEFKILEKSCQDCDITITIQEYPKSIDEGKKFISQGKIRIDLNKNVFYLLSKGYGNTYYCLQKL
jgi:hypothetical protein